MAVESNLKHVRLVFLIITKTSKGYLMKNRSVRMIIDLFLVSGSRILKRMSSAWKVLCSTLLPVFHFNVIVVVTHSGSNKWSPNAKKGA